MNLAAFLSLMDEDLRPQNSKIHLASWNGTEDPLDVYRAGRFEEWQAWQSKQNFGRESVVSLIRMPGKDRWLYAGSFVVAGCRWDPAEEMYKYALERRAKCTEFAGQLVVTFSRPGRQSYLNMESWASTIMVAEILPQRLSTGPFPGFKDVNISKVELDRIVEQHSESWHAALSSVAGVYLITETITDKLYVGSATGAGGIWQRWTEYSRTGHGGNIRLRDLVANGDKAKVAALRFSVLEIAAIETSVEQILKRESHWKNILRSRSCGLNAN